MKKPFALLTTLLLLGGCQSLAPSQPEKAAPGLEEIATKTAEQEAYGSFSADTLYALLTAELAGQRNRFDIALGNYVQQANATRDPGVAERAFRIAEYLGAEQAALDSALIWADTAKNSVDAQRAAAVQLARAERYDEAMVYMEKVLQRQGDTHFDFLALSAVETDPGTRAGLLSSFDRLLQKYPNNSQLLFGKAVLLQQDGRPDEALDSLGENMEVAPILLRARLLQELDRSDEALPLLRKGIRQHPDDKRLRLTYARMLVENGQIDDAKNEFASLLQQFPTDDDLRFSLALVSMEAGAWNEAQAYLEELLARGTDLDTVHYNLARVYEEQNHPLLALQEYDKVGPGADYLSAQLRRTVLLFDAGREAEAEAHLTNARQDQPDFAIQLYLIEAENYSERERYDDAKRVLNKALAQYPDDASLLYTRAMLAEKNDDLTKLESDLRRIIEREPENAMALNALGYTLADRTTRHEEARQLIEAAYRLAPEDPAVLDSMGWVNFRLGNLPEAEKYLRDALQRYPDGEIAAHLGEVLWVQGRRREAHKVWGDALKAEPDNAILRETMKRLTGSENP
jgi:tetratricopeptide (TPR) repeat protein